MHKFQQCVNKQLLLFKSFFIEGKSASVSSTAFQAGPLLTKNNIYNIYNNLILHIYFLIFFLTYLTKILQSKRDLQYDESFFSQTQQESLILSISFRYEDQFLSINHRVNIAGSSNFDSGKS